MELDEEVMLQTPHNHLREARNVLARGDRRKGLKRKEIQMHLISSTFMPDLSYNYTARRTISIIAIHVFRVIVLFEAFVVGWGL